MAILNLRIITPKKIVLEEKILGITVPATDGEMTILPHHTNLFALLKEGVLKIKKEGSEDLLAIGGGYVETDGENVNILVSRAYGQNEIDEKLTESALSVARKILTESKDKGQRAEAAALLRRSIIDSKLIKRRKAPTSYSS